MKQRFMDAGFSGCLTKPVMWRDLEQCLREWLPAELVRSGVFEEADFSAAGKDDRRYDAAEKIRDTSLARDLAAGGVLLEEGQRYLDPETGLAQYKRLAEFFTENHEAAQREALVMAGQKNWKDLRFSVHSLKSKAKAMGAADLYATAAAMEKYCGAGDGAYIEAALPLFLLEWERACRALEKFTARVDELAGAAEGELRGEETAAPGISRDADRETLLRSIRGNLFNEARETLNRLLAAASEPEKQKLKAAREKINSLDFEGAERLLAGE
jgi:HPt (histidine-containing phosphotransfer) domain-containing protein